MTSNQEDRMTHSDRDGSEPKCGPFWNREGVTVCINEDHEFAGPWVDGVGCPVTRFGADQAPAGLPLHEQADRDGDNVPSDRVRTYAEAIDPKAFDDDVPKSTRDVAVIQWAVRRKLALDAAHAAIQVADREQAALRATIARVEALVQPQWRSVLYDRNALLDDLRAALRDPEPTEEPS